MNSTWPRCVSALSMAMQTTCDVNGHRLMNLVISSRLAVLGGFVGKFFGLAEKVFLLRLVKISSGSAEVSMSKTMVAMLNCRNPL